MDMRKGVVAGMFAVTIWTTMIALPVEAQDAFRRDSPLGGTQASGAESGGTAGAVGTRGGTAGAVGTREGSAGAVGTREGAAGAVGTRQGGAGAVGEQPGPAGAVGERKGDGKNERSATIKSQGQGIEK